MIHGTETEYSSKTMLFCGDWRQIRPISKGDSPTDVVDIAFISSTYGNTSTGFGLQNHSEIKNPQYAAFVQDIGENKISPTMPDGQTLIPLNNHSQRIQTTAFTYSIRQILTSLLNSFILT